MGANLQKWIEKEKQWMTAYRRRTMRTLTHVTTPLVIVLLAVFFAGMAYMGEASTSETIYMAIGGAAFGAVIMGFVILIVRAGTSSGRMQRGIMNSIRAMGLDETEVDVLAHEMLEAAGNGEKELAFESKSPESSNPLPVCVTVTEHFAYMKGDAPLVNIVRREDVHYIETAEEKRQSTRRGAKIKTYYTFYVYSVDFIGKDGKPVSSFGFFDEKIRDRVRSMF